MADSAGMSYVRTQYLLEITLSHSGARLAYIPIYEDSPEVAEMKASRIMRALEEAVSQQLGSGNPLPSFIVRTIIPLDSPPGDFCFYVPHSV